jgi:hypothetical protein
MKATLFVIENDADHAQAKALIEKLMGSLSRLHWRLYWARDCC